MPLPPSLAAHEATAAAIAALLHPHGEVVLHDLASGRIAGIWNGFSSRRVGDPSLLDDTAAGFAAQGPVLGPYEKTGIGGSRLKSVTAVLPGAPGEPPAGLLCINLDVGPLDQAVRLLAAFAAPSIEPPNALFARDWRERINQALHAWLKNQGLALSALGRAEKIALVTALDREGLFETRRAAEHVASLIGASRASVYAYLAAARSADDLTAAHETAGETS